nr:hypothetical protein [Tanacetum cinerariifolium]
KLYADFVDMALHLEEKFYPHLLTTISGQGRTLADVAAYNPSAEADYVSTLQRLQNVNFSLLAELRSSKDASVDTIMNILRLEDNLAKREQEVADLDVVVTSVKLENDSLADQVASAGLQEKLSHDENLMERLEEFHDAQLKVVNDKLKKLYADFVDMALHLEEKFYPHLLTTISGRRWLLTHGMELAIIQI